MAVYNPYYAGAYQPYVAPYYTVPTIQQPQTPPAPAQQTGTLAANSIIWVTGERQAAEYPVAPNNAVALWDSSAPVIYLKTADASGKPVLKAYDLVERTQDVVKSPTSAETDKPIQTHSEDLSFVKSALNAIQGDLEKIKASIADKQKVTGNE